MRRRIFLTAVRILSHGPRLEQATHVVKVFFNTDEQGRWVYSMETPLEGLPKCIFGPFLNESAALRWIEEAYPDDTDVYDMFVDFARVSRRSLNDPVAPALSALSQSRMVQV